MSLNYINTRIYYTQCVKYYMGTKSEYVNFMVVKKKKLGTLGFSLIGFDLYARQQKSTIRLEVSSILLLLNCITRIRLCFCATCIDIQSDIIYYHVHSRRSFFFLSEFCNNKQRLITLSWYGCTDVFLNYGTPLGGSLRHDQTRITVQPRVKLRSGHVNEKCKKIFKNKFYT